MKPSCPSCESGPRDVAGHFDLMVQTIGSTRLEFECRTCLSRWARTSTAKGFTWERISERMGHTPSLGVVVPPRPASPYVQSRADTTPESS